MKHSCVLDIQADGEVDYDKLVKSFGSFLITEDIVARVERLTGMRAHRFLRRGLFFSHRDLTQVSKCLLFSPPLANSGSRVDHSRPL